jgi:hypothetical protein
MPGSGSGFHAAVETFFSLEARKQGFGSVFIFDTDPDPAFKAEYRSGSGFFAKKIEKSLQLKNT